MITQTGLIAVAVRRRTEPKNRTKVSSLMSYLGRLRLVKRFRRTGSTYRTTSKRVRK